MWDNREQMESEMEHKVEFIEEQQPQQLDLGTTVKMEALKARKAQHLLDSVRSIERFTGEPRELELFLDEMEAVKGTPSSDKD